MQTPSELASIPSIQSLGLDEQDDPCALKFLISNSGAGSIIGKGGATISQLQEQSRAKIKAGVSSLQLTADSLSLDGSLNVFWS